MDVLLRRAVATAAVGSLGLAMLTVAAPPAMAAAEPCAKETLRLPAGALAGFLNATDPTGRYQVGNYQAADEQWRFAFWQDGVPADLPLIANTYPRDVNARGDVAVTTLYGVGRSWRWRSGELVDLPVPAGTAGASAVAINARGEIAGESSKESPYMKFRDTRAVVWSAANVVRVLPRPDGFDGVSVSAIGDDGTVVGKALIWDYPTARVLSWRAVAWFSDGTWRFLPGTTEDRFTDARAIRRGTVVGEEAQGGRTLVWSARSGGATVLTTEMGPDDINANGSITLRSRTGFDNFLYQRGVGFRPLPQDTPTSSGGTAGVTDSEHVYGSDVTNGASVPVRWIC